MSIAGLPVLVKERIAYVHRLSAVLFPAVWVFSPGLSNIVLVLFGLTGLLVTEWKEITRIQGFTLIILLLSFLLLKVTGMLWTEDLKEGASLLERQVALLALPILLLAPGKITRQDVRAALYLFTLVCLLLALFSLVMSLMTYRENLKYVGGANLYDFLWLHPSYFSMYLVFCFFFLIKEGIHHVRKNRMLRASAIIITSAFLFVYLILMNARTTTLIFLVLLVLTSAYYLLRSHPRFRFVAVASGLLIALMAYLIIHQSYMVQNDLVNRFEEGIMVRKAIWTAGWETAKESWLYGAGTGDSRTALFSTYERMGMEEQLTLRYNAHSQYLETFIRHGILGVIGLLLIFAWLLYTGYRQKNWLMVLLVLLFAGECLTEVMLDRQLGLYFFGYFAALLHFLPKPSVGHESKA